MRIETKSYYFDSENGDDSHQACDLSHPFKSLDKANSLLLNPGDRLLFKRGCAWRGQLHPQGSGADGMPLVIDQYGEADFPPLIEAAGAESAVCLHNQEYWTIAHIAVSNRAADISVPRNGIAVLGKDAGALHAIRLADIRVHAVQGSPKSCGIIVKVLGDGKPTWFEGVTIDNCRVEQAPHTGVLLGSAWGTLPGGQKSGAALPIAPWKNVAVTNNFVADAGFSGILVCAADSPLISRNVVAASNWNLQANGYGVGLWAFGCIDAIFEFNEVYDTREPYCGMSNGADGNAFDISRNLRCTYRHNFSHDNRGGFILIDNYCTPSVNSGNIVHDNLSRDDELEFFEIMGVGATRIINNILHAGKDLDYKPCPFYCDPAGTPTDYGNIAEPSFDVLCAGNVFSSEPACCRAYEILPSRMDFQWRPAALAGLAGVEGGLDFGECGWATDVEQDSQAKFLFLDRAEPGARGIIDFARHSIRLHAVRGISGAGRVVIASDNAGNRPVECLLDGMGDKHQTVETGWRFPAGVVTFSIDNPQGARQTKFRLLDYYSNHAYTFAHNHFVNLAVPGDDQREGYVVALNNQVLADRAGLPADKARRLQGMLDDEFLLVDLAASEMPPAAWIARHYADDAAPVARIDGEPVSALELRLAAESERPQALAEMLTAGQFRARSLRRCFNDAMLRICAREQGLIRHSSVFAVLFAMQQANQRRAAAGLTFGPESLREDLCLDYVRRNLTIRLRKKLRPVLQPTAAQIDAYWEAFHKAVPWAQRAKAHIGMVKELIDQNFERYIEQKAERCRDIMQA